MAFFLLYELLFNEVTVAINLFYC